MQEPPIDDPRFAEGYVPEPPEDDSVVSIDRERSSAGASATT